MDEARTVSTRSPTYGSHFTPSSTIRGSVYEARVSRDPGRFDVHGRESTLR